MCLSQKLSSSGANLSGQGDGSASAWSPPWDGGCVDRTLQKPVAGSFIFNLDSLKTRRKHPVQIEVRILC